MGEEGCRTDYHDAFELVFMLRLEYEEEEADDVEHDERLVDHAGANLVGVAGAQEVDCSDDCQQGDEAEVHQLMHGYHGIVEQRVEVDETGKMSDEVVDVVGIDKESCRKPVGDDDSQDGGCKVAETEGVGEEHHHRPQYGQIIEYLYKLHRGYAQTGEGIEGAARGLPVLIAVPDEQGEGNETEGHHVGMERRLGE